MERLYGEYECRLDSKGRLKVPSHLLRQVGAAEPVSFFVNRSYESRCLMLYSREVWEEKVELLSNLNQYDPDNKKFIRYFFRGVSLLPMDSSERILLPKSFLEWAQIDQDVIISAYLENIEIWSKELYTGVFDENLDEFGQLGAKVMGGLDFGSLFKKKKDE